MTYVTSDAARERMRDAARARSAAIEPRNAAIRAECARATGDGIRLALVRRYLAAEYGLTTVRIAQICKERLP